MAAKRQDSPRRHVLLALGWYNHRINEGVARYARQAGWYLDCSCIRGGVPGDDWAGDGVITLLPEQADSPLVQFVRKTSAAVVDLSLSNASLLLPRVLEDSYVIGRMAADYFAANGFKHLAFCNEFTSWSAELRMKGFCAAAREAGCELHDIDFLDEAGEPIPSRLKRQWLADRLAMLPKPLGVMGINDELATGILLAAAQADLAVPQQVAVIGVDNDPFARELAPVPLSSVDSDPANQGYQAAALLDKIMAGGRAPARPIFLEPKGIIVRQSTDTIAVEDMRVAEALSFIRENYRRPIGADEVAEHIAMSRRRLHDLFLLHAGRSVADEITRRRIEHAKRLLTTTDDPVQQIARRVGFSSGEHMSKTFHRVTGTTPTACRADRDS